jgi:DNA-directed RNA polymerase specialized sigma24 family protein
MDTNITFEGLSDRDIAEKLFNQYGARLFYYAMKSWDLNEDDIWEILYDTLYGFISSYSGDNFSSQKRIENLIWTIFKNKLRDKYRQKRRIKEHYQEVVYSEGNLTKTSGMLVEKDDYLFLRYSDQVLIQEEQQNPILSNLEAILDSFKDWERQLVIGRANGITYILLEEMTGKKADFLKVHYQRLKQRISKELKDRMKRKEGTSCPKLEWTE